MLLLPFAMVATCIRAQPSRYTPPGPTEPHFMMLLASGCSGSTWAFDTTVKMIEAHRIANHSSVLPVMLGPTRFVACATRPLNDHPLPTGPAWTAPPAPPLPTPDRLGVW